MILGIPDANYESGGVSTVNESDSAVVKQEEIVGHLPDGGAAGIVVSSYRQEQLMLRWRQTLGLRLLLAPALEVT